MVILLLLFLLSTVTVKSVHVLTSARLLDAPLLMTIATGLATREIRQCALFYTTLSVRHVSVHGEPSRRNGIYDVGPNIINSVNSCTRSKSPSILLCFGVFLSGTLF